MTAADLCIEAFAQEACDLSADLRTYRVMLSVALEQLRDAERRQVALQTQLQSVKDELRRYVAARVSA